MKQTRQQNFLSYYISWLVCIILISSPVTIGSLLNPPQQTENTDTTITVHYTFQPPQLTQKTIGNTIYWEILMSDDITCFGAPGEPVLPRKQATIMLPYGTTIKDITVHPSPEITIGSGYTVIPGEEPILLTSTDPIPPPIPNTEIYHSTQPIFSQPYDVVGVQLFRGIPLATISLYPVQYTPSSGTLSYYPTITIEITTTPEHTAQELYRGLPTDIQETIEMVDNPETAKTYPLITPQQTKNISLLLITTNELKPGFQRLIQAHSREKIFTIVKTLGTDIPIGDSTNQTCENIRDYIRTIYNRYGIRYVLIGGDIDVIPAPYLLNFVPSDFYYACLDGPYNNDHDSYWGEANDGTNGGDVDLMAEVYVGRASVGNLTEVGHFVNKTLRYMKGVPQISPYDYKLNLSTINDYNRYMKSVVMAGEYLFGTPDNPDNPLIFGDTYIERLINGSSIGYTTVGVPSDEYHIQRLYDHTWPGFDPYNPTSTGWPGEVMLGIINNGTHIINHLGHSGNFYNMRIYVDEVDALTNKQLCFIYSEGCDAGAFDQDAYQHTDCIAEHFTIKTEYAAFAGIWNARPGYADTSNRVHRYFWDTVFKDGITIISKANQVSKQKNIQLIHSDYGMRYHCYQLNYFGDPVLAFHLQLHADAHGPYEGIIDLPLQFNGVAFGGTPPYRWLWTFHDGTTSQQQNPQKIFHNLGTFTATLTVTDALGRTDRNQTRVTIAEPIVVNPHGPYWGVTNLYVHFIGSAQGGIPPYTWEWEFGDGEQPSPQQSPFHAYTEPGNYTVTLTVTDSHGNNKSRNTTVFIGEPPQQVWVNATYTPSAPWYGYDHFATIPDGIGAVAPNGTVFVFSGGYYQEVLVFKPVTLIGEDVNRTIIDGEFYRSGITLMAENITVTGFTIRNTSGTAIRCLSSHGTIFGNHLDGAWIERATDTIIQDNVFLSSGVFIIGEEPSQWTTHTIQNNQLADQQIYYYADVHEPQEVPLNAAQVILANCSNITLHNLTLYAAGNSILLGFSSHNLIVNNSVTAAPSYSFLPVAITLYHSLDNTIAGNTVFGSQNGISIAFESTNNRIINNTIQNNQYDGIVLYSQAHNTTIRGNTITGNEFGIEIQDSSGIVIEENVFQGNINDGIILFSSDQTIIRENLFDSNYRFGIHTNNAQYLQIEQNNITGSYGGGLIIRSQSNHALIQGNQLDGFFVEGCSYARIMNNTLRSFGLVLQGWTRDQWITHTIENNTINEKPIYYYANTDLPQEVPVDGGQVILANCSNITVQGLTITTVWNGIQLAYSSDNTISDNTVAQNEHGIFLIDSVGNIVSGNTVEMNSYGVKLQHATSNQFFDNTIRYNSVVGLFCDSTSASNIIYHNNFIENSMWNAVTDLCNIWNMDYPIGGNYWSDYTSQYPDPQDLDEDGIWDYAYHIGGMYGFLSQPNYDYYPYVNENGWQ
ncbi:MAG: right-handed parallel beta-helix repeat-containing protein [Methanobacteriota archaeon]